MTALTLLALAHFGIYSNAARVADRAVATGDAQGMSDGQGIMAWFVTGTAGA